MSLRGDMKRLVRSAIKRGWQIAQSKRGQHSTLTWTDGSKVVVSSTPSDSHAIANATADLKRVERLAVDTNASKPYSNAKYKGDIT